MYGKDCFNSAGQVAGYRFFSVVNINRERSTLDGHDGGRVFATVSTCVGLKETSEELWKSEGERLSYKHD